jgi:hypothetical protein
VSAALEGVATLVGCLSPHSYQTQTLDVTDFFFLVFFSQSTRSLILRNLALMKRFKIRYNDFLTSRQHKVICAANQCRKNISRRTKTHPNA